MGPAGRMNITRPNSTFVNKQSGLTGQGSSPYGVRNDIAFDLRHLLAWLV